MSKFLDETGVSTLWNKCKDTFGTVKTVNGNSPDANGDVTVSGGSGAFIPLAGSNEITGQLTLSSDKGASLGADGKRWYYGWMYKIKGCNTITNQSGYEITLPNKSGTFALTSDTVAAANKLPFTGTDTDCATAYQTSSSYHGSAADWASYLIFNHGNGGNYYHQMLRMPFWSSPQYQRMEGGTNGSWHNFLTDENTPKYTHTIRLGNSNSGGMGVSFELKNNVSSAYTTGEAVIKAIYDAGYNSTDNVLWATGSYPSISVYPMSVYGAYYNNYWRLYLQYHSNSNGQYFSDTTSANVAWVQDFVKPNF